MFKKGENIILGISIGDMNGIGPEVILKTFEDPRMMELCTPVVFGHAKLVSSIRTIVNCNNGSHRIDTLDEVQRGKCNVLNVWREGVNLELGPLDENEGIYAIISFIAATIALKDGLIDALVTAPVNKYNIQTDGFSFP